MLPVINYLIHLLAAAALLAVFVMIYVRVTPFDEFALIRQGMVAPALSLGGTMLGFSLTLASGIINNATLFTFLLWGLIAGAVQVAAYGAFSRLFPGLGKALEEDNIAMGCFIGCSALVVGVINAACLS